MTRATLGRYRILERLAWRCHPGGEVLRALDTQSGREVVLTTSPSSASSEEERARSRAEIERLAQLDHPHVLRVLDQGSEDGLDFVIQEFSTHDGRFRFASPSIDAIVARCLEKDRSRRFSDLTELTAALERA